MKTKKKHTQAGFTSLEILGGLVVLLMLLPVLASLMESGLNNIRKRAVADHLAKVLDAASAYSRTHWTNLTGVATATHAVSISMAQLRADRFLPDGFADTNPWGQSYTAYALQPSAGELQVLVITSGGRGAGEKKSFLNSDVPSCAALIGGAGGFVPTGDMPGQPGGSLQGAFGGWRMDLSATDIPDPGAGHIGALVSLRDGDLGKDFLYRVKVPGHPELNQMATELDMTDHAINGVREVRFESHSLAEMGVCDPSKEGRVFFDPDEGLYICRNGQVELLTDTGNSLLVAGSTIASNGDIIPKPHCPTGTDTRPEIFVVPVLAEAGNLSDSIVSVQAWATDLGSSWRVNLRILTTDTSKGWISPAPEHGKLQVMTTCN